MTHTPEPQMGISEGTETERTESVFSGGGNAVRTADAFEDSRTESVFGHQTPDGTERTESVFHKPAPKKCLKRQPRPGAAKNPAAG